MTLRYTTLLLLFPHPAQTIKAMPSITPPNAIPTDAAPFISHTSPAAALDDPLAPEPPAPLEPELDGDEEVGPETADVGEGVKTPPDGSWAIHDEAAAAASWAVLGPACQPELPDDKKRLLTTVAQGSIAVKVAARVDGVELVVCAKDVRELDGGRAVC